MTIEIDGLNLFVSPNDTLSNDVGSTSNPGDHNYDPVKKFTIRGYEDNAHIGAHLYEAAENMALSELARQAGQWGCFGVAQFHTDYAYCDSLATVTLTGTFIRLTGVRWE